MGQADSTARQLQMTTSSPALLHVLASYSCPCHLGNKHTPLWCCTAPKPYTLNPKRTKPCTLAEPHI